MLPLVVSWGKTQHNWSGNNLLADDRGGWSNTLIKALTLIYGFWKRAIKWKQLRSQNEKNVFFYCIPSSTRELGAQCGCGGCRGCGPPSPHPPRPPQAQQEAGEARAVLLDQKLRASETTLLPAHVAAEEGGASRAVYRLNLELLSHSSFTLLKHLNLSLKTNSSIT